MNKEKELPATKCTQESFYFPDVKKRTVEVNFQDGDITSDGGVMLLRQRVYVLGCGYEDLDDHRQLHHDFAIQSAAEREVVLAGSSTLCCRENQANRQTAWYIYHVMIEWFVASFKQAP